VIQGSTSLTVKPLVTSVAAGASVAVDVVLATGYLSLYGTLPGGNVTVTLGSQSITAPWQPFGATGNASLEAVVTFTNVPAGILPLMAYYAGDSNWLGSAANGGTVISLASKLFHDGFGGGAGAGAARAPTWRARRVSGGRARKLGLEFGHRPRTGDDARRKHMTRSRRRRAPLVLLIAIGVLVAACGSGSAGGAGANQANCDHWCGHGTATVTIAGTTTKISGGGCYDQGSDGVDVRFGDWMDDGPINYLALTVYRAGGPTPPPADAQPPAATDPAAPTASRMNCSRARA